MTIAIHDGRLDESTAGAVVLRPAQATSAQSLVLDEAGTVAVAPTRFVIDRHYADQLAAPWPAGRRAVLEVDERVHLGDPCSPANVVRLGFVRRAARLDRAAFSVHWNDRHVGLVLRSGPMFVRYLTYVITGLALSDGTRVPSRWDGVVLQWFPSVEALDMHDREVRRGTPAVAADIERFVSEFTSYVLKEQS